MSQVVRRGSHGQPFAARGYDPTDLHAPLHLSVLASAS